MHVAPLAEARDIRVRLFKRAKQFTLIAGNGVFRIGDKRMHFKSLVLNFANGHFRYALDEQYKKVRPSALRVHAENITINGDAHPEKLALRAHLDGSVDVIALMAIEQYLRGVVPSEMYSNWPIEALKAQAIAARSYAYQRMQGREGMAFDVEASVADQQFKYYADKVPKRIDRALQETRDVILYGEKERVFEALYHADCGGMTENAANVWGGTASQKRADCPHPTRHWRAELDRKSLVDQFISHFKLPKQTGIKSLQAVGRSQAGRVREVRVAFTEGSARHLSSQAFRKIVGYDRVPSSNFELSWLGPQLKIAGLGQGHGVGLCQLGARALAKAGKTAEEILQFYYPKTHLAQVRSLALSKTLAAE